MATANSGSGDPGPKSMSSILIAILAIFGLSTMRGNVSTSPAADEHPGASTPADAPSLLVAPSADAASDAAEEAEIMRPLLDHFRVETGDAKSLKVALGRTEDDADRPLLCLIATVPDPVQSTNSHRFDEWIGSIRRACESEQFVLDGFRIPWAPQAGTTPARPAAPPVGGRQPGLMLFRSSEVKAKGRSTDPTLAVKGLLAVFLVPETPTMGLDKGAMHRSLNLAERWDIRNRDSVETARFSILGPTFSGAQDSLEETLRARCLASDKSQDFDIITGSATAIDAESLANCVEEGDSVSFSSTMHMNIALLFEMLAHIGQEDDIAILAESDTGFGQIAQNNHPQEQVGRLVYYPFPLHISKVRGYYERKGYLKDNESQAIPSAERLRIPFEEGGNPSDIVGAQTPGFTTAVEELVLNQILMDIDRRDIRKVGIIATDPLDVVFLARQVRRFCPDVLLFTTQSHLLFTHPQHVADLRGMLTASTYPLYPLNQLWSYSYRGDTTHSYFSGDTVQGTYNATVAQLDRMDLNPRTPPRFLEYGSPFDAPGVPTKEEFRPRKPPIWIGVVGNHGIYPVKAIAGPSRKLLTEEDDRYVLEHMQPRKELMELWPAPGGNPREPRFRELTRGWFRLLPQHYWLFLFGVVSIACLTVVGIQWLVLRWNFRDSLTGSAERSGTARRPLDRLALFLNCRRADDAVDDLHPRGPGPYLLILLAVFTFIYALICWPLLQVSWDVPWMPIGLHNQAFWVVWVAYAVLLSLLVSSIVSSLTRLIPLARSVRPIGWTGRFPQSRFLPSRESLQEHLHWLAIIAALALGALVLIVQLASRYGEDHDFDAQEVQRDGMFRLLRGMAVPSGVSPVLSMIFLGIAWLAWAYAQVNRRFIFDQFTPKRNREHHDESGAEDQEGAGGRRVDEKTFEALFGLRDRFEELLASPVRLVLHTNSAVILLTALCGGYLLLPIFLEAIGRHGKFLDGPMFEVVSATLFFALFVLLAFHALQLIMLWNNISALMKLVIQLPLAAALDRLPTRVARWFTESPKEGGGRFDLIRRQAIALAEYTKRSDADTDMAKGLNLSPEAMKILVVDLKQLQERSVGSVPERIRRILQEQWADLSVTVAYAGGSTPPSTGSPDVAPQVDEWVRQAEDLLALFFMRWLSASLAQVWNLMKFLVIACLAMLLAVSSYPFSFQDRFMFRLGLLIGALVVMILVIVLGFNRNEVISRISNTPPNQFKIDQNLVGAIFTYVVPLLGVLAALSLDSSDTIRSLLDPITRHLR